MTTDADRALPAGAEPAAPRWRRWARAVGPWLVTAAVLVVLFSRYDLGQVVREMARPGAFAVLPILLATSLLSLVTLAAADRQVVPAALALPRPVALADLARARAGTAMLIGIHHGASTGGFGLWLARTNGVDLRTAVSSLAYLTATDLGAGCSIALVACALGGLDQVGPSARVALALAALAVGLVVTAGLAGRRLMRTRFLVDRVPRLTAAWARVPPRRFLAGLALRALNVVLWVTGTWLAARAFGLPLSLGVMAANLPLVAIIAALPLSVGGLGAAQAAWVAAFESWTSGESILAFQFVLHTSVTIGFVARGLPFIRRVLREITDGRPVAAA